MSSCAASTPERRGGEEVIHELTNVDLRVAFQERARELAARVQRLVGPFTGDERVLDSGCGAGALAFALASHVREVVGVDASPDLLAAGRERAPANVTLRRR